MAQQITTSKVLLNEDRPAHQVATETLVEEPPCSDSSKDPGTPTYGDEVRRIKAFGQQGPSADEILKFCANPSPTLTRLMHEHGMLKHILEGINTVQDTEYAKLLREAWPKGIPMSEEGAAMLDEDLGPPKSEAEAYVQQTPEADMHGTRGLGGNFSPVGVQEDERLKERYGAERYAEALSYARAFEACMSGQLDQLIRPEGCPYHQRAIKFVRAFHKKLMEDEKAEEEQSEMDPHELWDDCEVPPSPQPETAHMEDPFKDLMVRQPSVKYTPEEAARVDAVLKERGWLSTSDFTPKPLKPLLRPSTLPVGDKEVTQPQRQDSFDDKEKPLTIDIPQEEGLYARRMRLLKSWAMKGSVTPSTDPHKPVQDGVHNGGCKDGGKSITLTRGGAGVNVPPTKRYEPEIVVISDAEEEGGPTVPESGGQGRYYRREEEGEPTAPESGGPGRYYRREDEGEPTAPESEGPGRYYRQEEEGGPTVPESEGPGRYYRQNRYKRKYDATEDSNKGSPDAKRARFRLTLNVPLPVSKYLTKAFYNGDTVYTRRFGDRGIYVILTTRGDGEGFIQKKVNGRIVASMYLTMTGLKQLYQNAYLIKYAFKKLQSKQHFKPLRHTLEKGKTILIKYPYTTFNIRDWEAKQYGKFALRGGEVYEFVDFLVKDMPRVFLPLADVEVFKPDE